MRNSRFMLLLAGLVAATARPVPAQALGVSDDSAQDEIRTTLRAFYFSLAHHDWEALTAHILPAKVVAHLPMPAVLVAAPGPGEQLAGSAPATGEATSCEPDPASIVRRARISLAGGWARASVPHCGGGTAGEPKADEFRLVRFDGRWWIVFIEGVGSRE